MRVNHELIRNTFKLFISKFYDVPRFSEELNNILSNYDLNYCSVYGGWEIQSINEPNGGVDLPFGLKRYNTKEFYQVLEFAITVLDQKKRLAVKQH